MADYGFNVRAPLTRGGMYVDRQPYAGERKYFSANPHVAGMAAEDDKVVMNPFSPLSAEQREAVRRNEMARILMRTNQAYAPPPITEDQSALLRGTTYEGARPEDRAATISARQYSGDPSGGSPTAEQAQLLELMRTYLGVREAPFSIPRGGLF
jgi:hypothetical protein